MSSVAVKNPETSSTGPLDRLHVGVLAGVVYVVGSLAILFELLPWLWWAPGPLGLAPPAAGNPALGATVGLILVGLAVAAGLAYLGARLLGPSPTPGVKAGIFTGLVTLLVIALLTRWASLYFEGWVYDSRTLPNETYGIVLTAVVGVLLLVLAGRFLFLAPSFGAKTIAFEDQGWFSARSFKRSQGRLVRRGTIVGILALAGCGVYALQAHKTLAGTAAWGIGIPFSGKAEIRSLNDARILYADRRPVREVEVTLPDRVGDSPLGISKEKSRPEPDAAGKVAGVTVGDVVVDSPAWKADIHDGDTITAVDGKPVEDVEGLRGLLEGAKEEGKTTVKLTVLAGSGFVVDQGTLRDKNNELKTNYLKITERGDSSFEAGEVVTKDRYEEVRKEIAAAKEPGAKEPTFKTPDPAKANVIYATIPLLPHVKFTLPILLVVLSIWLAWRVVNVPSFADFLIATEAELNKVSWTSRRRLIQDTIVVLITVILFTVFLFVVDVAWGQILSWDKIGVLKLPEKGQGNQAPEQNW